MCYWQVANRAAEDYGKQQVQHGKNWNDRVVKCVWGRSPSLFDTSNAVGLIMHLSVFSESFFIRLFPSSMHKIALRGV